MWDWSHARQFTQDQLPRPYIKDDYLQILENLYIGPDGSPPDVVDFANHSCNPNCRIYVALPLIHLVALRDIAVGEEITYDYGVTMYDDPWTMKCNCGESNCRGLIGDRRTTTDYVQTDHFVCPSCGPHARADQDWCCSVCGKDCEIEKCACSVKREADRT